MSLYTVVEYNTGINRTWCNKICIFGFHLWYSHIWLSLIRRWYKRERIKELYNVSSLSIFMLILQTILEW